MFDNLARILPPGLSAYVDAASWPVPPVFEYLFSLGPVERREKYRTFNMGIGFVVVLPERWVRDAVELLSEIGETVYRIGCIRERRREKVVLDS